MKDQDRKHHDDHRHPIPPALETLEGRVAPSGDLAPITVTITNEGQDQAKVEALKPEAAVLLDLDGS